MPDNIVTYTLSLKDLLTGQINNADASVNRLESSLSKAQNALGRFGAAVGVAFSVAGVVAFGRSIIQAGTMVEDATTGLTTALHSSAAAAEVVAQTMKDAESTPFSFQGLLDGNLALISAGESAGSARESILNLGNAVAGAGKGNAEFERMVYNLQQIKTVGQATAVDVRQFGVAGINIYEMLHRSTGKSIAQLKEMDVTYEMIAASLKAAAGAGGVYENAMKNMANNTSVKISNLGDSIFNLSVKMYQDLRPAIVSVIKSLASLIQTFRSVWDFIVKHKALIIEIAKYIAVAGAAWLTYRGILLGVVAVQKAQVIWNGIQYASINLLGDGFLTASAASKVLTAAQWALNVAMDANPIGVIIAALAAVAAGFMWAYKHSQLFRAILYATWENVKEFGKIVSDIFNGLYHVIHGVFNLDVNEIKLGSVQQIDAVFNAAKRMGDANKRGFAAGMADFAADQVKDKAGEPKKSLVTNGVKPRAVTGSSTSTPGVKEPKTKATGSKSVTINITIGKLIGEYTSKITNIAGMTNDLRKIVLDTLVSAVNDSQLIVPE